MLDAQHLQEQAKRCRRLARDIGNADVEARLTLLADEYEERARQLRGDLQETRSFAPPEQA